MLPVYTAYHFQQLNLAPATDMISFFFVGEGRVKDQIAAESLSVEKKSLKTMKSSFFRLARSVATYSPFSVRSFMSPSNGIIIGKSLGMTVRLSTPPIHRLPFSLTGPGGNPASIVKSRSSSFTLLLKQTQMLEKGIKATGSLVLFFFGR